ncbi:MAG TPA: HAD family phosphatase [Gemmatimonadales bacterium]
MMFDHDRAHRALGHLVNLTPQHVQERLRAAGLRKRMETGGISAQQFPLRLLKALGSSVTVSTDRIAQAWSDIFTPNAPMIDALARAGRRVPLALLSNTDVMHFEFIAKKWPEVIALFEGRLALSYEVGAAKPDPAIYKRALELVGCAQDPGNCLYVDDIAEYVSAAGALGMRALQYTTHDAFVTELAQAGLSVR